MSDEKAPTPIETALDAMIATLEAARADAQKCDKGRAGAPGTRVRKAAAEAREGLGELRKLVLAARK